MYIMEKPELYTKGNSKVIINKAVLEKYGQFLRWGKSPESIIEAGIGDGKVTQHVIIPFLPKNLKEYVGTDISDKMLEFSNNLIDHPKYKTAVLDICAKEIPQEFHNRFDKAFASLLLHMVGSNAKQALRNLYKLLKPGGQLMYTAFERLPMGEAYEKLDKTKWRKYKHSNILSPFWDTKSPFEEYKKLTLEIGFLEDIITLMDDQCIYAPNNEVARNVWESVNMVLKEVPSEEYSQYFEDYIKFIKQSSTFSEDINTGEQRVGVKVVVAIVTKPVPA